jgi:putative oxidoreductase
METHSQKAAENAGAAPLSLLGRLLLSVVFFASVPAHFGPVDLGYAVAAGVPFANLVVPATGILALIGSISVLLGYRTKLGAWFLILFLAPVTLTMHNFWAANDTMKALQMGMFLRNVSIIGGLLLLSQYGPGSWSLDARQKSPRK